MRLPLFVVLLGNQKIKNKRIKLRVDFTLMGRFILITEANDQAAFKGGILIENQ